LLLGVVNEIQLFPLTQYCEREEKLMATVTIMLRTKIDEIDNDVVWHELDERFGHEVLVLPAMLFEFGGPFEALRLKMAQELSIRGNK
jgi:hypothetical protein